MYDRPSKYTRDRMAELRAQGIREVAIVLGWIVAGTTALLALTLLLR